MKRILLSKGYFALVDDEDFEWLSQWKWTYDGAYARRNISLGYINGKYRTQKVYMHRLIMDTKEGTLTDHINRNCLDNRRCNLRIADKSINSINRDKPSNNTSGYKGISWEKRVNKWYAYINFNGKMINLGHYKNIQDAILARQKGEEQYHAI